MNRLPVKTKGPIRVDASDHVIVAVDARREVSGATPRVVQSLDRALTLKLLRFPGALTVEPVGIDTSRNRQSL